MPMHPRRQGKAYEYFSMAEAGHGLDPQRDQGAREGRLLASPESGLLSAEQACDTPQLAAAPAGS
jgi:hypothetical protein